MHSHTQTPGGVVFRMLFAAAMLHGACSSASAGSVNPDISVIGDIRGVWTDADPAEDEVDLDLHEVEIAWVGPLNPWASAEVYLGIHGTEGIEVEEAKIMLDRYFPAGLGLTVGRMLLDFGQINPTHAHAYPHLDRPLMHERFFGADGALDTGIRLDWLAPVDVVTLRATIGAVRGDVLLGGHTHDHADEGADDGEEDDHHAEEVDDHDVEPEVGYTGRVDLFVEPTADVSFLLGASVLTGEWDPHENSRATWIDVDGKLRFDLGPDRTLLFNGEAVFGSVEAGAEGQADADPVGWFTSTELRFNRRWNAGGFMESATERLHDEHETRRFGTFIGFSLLEESTMFRVLGRVTDPEEGDSSREVIVQALFGLGPHQAHRY